jgi:hypothetical protein
LHGWQANKKSALVRRQYRLGLCPKMKYHPLCGWIFIAKTLVVLLILVFFILIILVLVVLILVIVLIFIVVIIH